MSTVMKKSFGQMPFPPATAPLNKAQLRRDRRTAVIVVAIIVAMMGLIIWLASVSGGGVSPGIDYWPMMP